MVLGGVRDRARNAWALMVGLILGAVTVMLAFMLTGWHVVRDVEEKWEWEASKRQPPWRPTSPLIPQSKPLPQPTPTPTGNSGCATGEVTRNDVVWVDEGSEDYPTASSVAIVAFVGDEGSSWLMQLLRATQKVSKNGKICVLGYEPLELPLVGRDLEEVKEWRKEFYMEFARMVNDNKTEWEAWIRRLNDILRKIDAERKVSIQATCDHRSKLFIFKARIGGHFDMEMTSPEDSRWLVNYSRRLQNVNGKLLLLRRYNILDRNIKRPSTGSPQFLLQGADTIEEKELILAENANITVDFDFVTQESNSYRLNTAKSSKLAEFLMIPSAVIYYEDLVDQFRLEMARMMRFLEVPVDYDLDDLLSMASFEKVSPSRMCEKVSDYRTFCEHFRQTDLAGYLDEPCDTNCS